MRLLNLTRSIGLASSLLTAALHAQTNHRGEGFPQQNLPRNGRSQEIPGMLGAKLGQVAAWYDRSEADLVKLCQQEKHLRSDRQGHLHFVCEGLLPMQNAIVKAQTTSGSTSAAAITAVDAFTLHSKPGATKVIYLDFDGHTTTGTSWNSSFTSGASIVTPPYSTDATVTTAFSQTELDNIYSIWQRVAEDYAPFDVDVTTQDPGLEALRKTTTSDTQFGVRVCIGGSSYDWYGAGAGGVAYLNSFTWNSDTPCFVFTAQLGNGAAKYTAEAASHEAGHTFNLSHDGQVAHDNVAAVGYYQGHANWAPIMGVGYYKDVVQWSKGSYPYANNLQDDTAIIASVVGYRVDAHGDSIVNATPLTGSALSASGIIERRADADLFAFTTGSGPVSFSATPAAPSPNLDINLALYDGFGNLVTSANPATLEATLATTLSQGTYYLAVEGAGTGDPLTAYDDYASLGQFSLTGTVSPVTGVPPVAVADASAPVTGAAPLAVNFSSVGSYDSDGSIVAYDWDFGDGTTSSVANPVKSYSTPGTYTASLVVVDNSGLASVADTVLITVASNKVIYVANIAMTLSSSKQGYQATATVTVRNQNGALVPNATVVGQWSGLTTGTVSKTTGRSGTAALASTRTKSRGTFTFTVTGISLSGYMYTPTRNVETSDRIATP
ncbi:MAG: PKD domain-containing protein [Prosthecobacter sp.]|jgi:PKD repeat protein|uniref:PKD domain-containing protein n=1 Tax=Prosthecobacter sp. TaxID=1965333 RepID=UPI0019E6995C|nr:PKD domain-containing protein [Prosthecobacter sp.]MBE2286070.1 PKD domain-containing protein [Prosthecobacter sp.]